MFLIKNIKKKVSFAKKLTVSNLQVPNQSFYTYQKKVKNKDISNIKEKGKFCYETYFFQIPIPYSAIQNFQYRTYK